MAITNDPTTLHRILGIVAFTSFLVMQAVSMLPGYELSRIGSLLLVASFLTFLGFGQIVGRVIGASLTGTGGNRAEININHPNADNGGDTGGDTDDDSDAVNTNADKHRKER